MLLSLGGVLGGAFASLAAPALFASLLEYPILLLATVLCRPGVMSGLAALTLNRLAAGALALAAVAALPVFAKSAVIAAPTWLFLGVVVAIATRLALSRERPLALLATSLVFVLLAQAMDLVAGPVARERSFFAVHEVKDTPMAQDASSFMARLSMAPSESGRRMAERRRGGPNR